MRSRGRRWLISVIVAVTGATVGVLAIRWSGHGGSAGFARPVSALAPVPGYDTWIAELEKARVSGSPAPWRAIGVADAGKAEVALFTDGAQCGFAFRRPDGSPDAIAADLPRDQSSAAGTANTVDTESLNRMTIPAGYGFFGGGAVIGARDASTGAGSGPSDFGLICGQYGIALVLPASFGVPADTLAFTGAVEAETLGDGRTIVVAGDGTVRAGLTRLIADAAIKGVQDQG